MTDDVIKMMAEVEREFPLLSGIQNMKYNAQMGEHHRRILMIMLNHGCTLSTVSACIKDCMSARLYLDEAIELTDIALSNLLDIKALVSVRNLYTL